MGNVIRRLVITTHDHKTCEDYLILLAILILQEQPTGYRLSGQTAKPSNISHSATQQNGQTAKQTIGQLAKQPNSQTPNVQQPKKQPKKQLNSQTGAKHAVATATVILHFVATCISYVYILLAACFQCICMHTITLLFITVTIMKTPKIQIILMFFIAILFLLLQLQRCLLL